MDLDLEWQSYVAHPTRFIISATPIESDRWPLAVEAFCSAFPEEMAAHLILRVEAVDLKTAADVVERLSQTLAEWPQGAEKKIFLSSSPGEEEFLGTIIDFPLGHFPAAAEYRYWWARGLANSIVKNSPDAKWWRHLPKAHVRP